MPDADRHAAMPDAGCCAGMPRWLQDAGIDDSFFAAAYAACHDQERAVVKTCIARHHAFFGVLPKKIRNTATRGEVELGWEDTPCPYTILFCPADFSDPLALCAAVMPALLAGTPLLYPIFILEDASDSHMHQSPLSTALTRGGKDQPAGTKPVSEPASRVAPALLTTLELAGVEEAYVLSSTALEEAAIAIHGMMRRVSGPGRILSLEIPLRLPDALQATPASTLYRKCSRADASCGSFTARMQPGYTQDMHIWPSLPPEWFRNRHYEYTPTYGGV